MTLDEALQVVAESSFYEDKLVYFAAGEWSADDDTPYYSYEDVTWTDDGLDFGADTPPLDHSGIMETYQTFSVSAQIRRYLPQAVEALERGHSVLFTYQPISVGILNEEEDDDDTLAGWVLIAEDQGPTIFEVCQECAGMIANGLEAPVQTLPGDQVVGDEADITQCDNCGDVFPLWVDGFECSTR